MASLPTVPVHRFSFDNDRVTAVVTTRLGGVSEGEGEGEGEGDYASLNLGDHVGDDHAAVMENRRRVCQTLELPQLTVADQQHRNRVAVIGAELAGRGHVSADDARAALPATDGMVTNIPGVALAIAVADCAPVVLVDPRRHTLGVAHCGRGGTTLGVLTRTIERMHAHFGTDPADLLAGIGPHIAACSYEVGAQQAAEAEEAFPGLGVVQPTRPQHYSFDIKAALLAQLNAAGVSPGRVETFDVDTYTHTDEYFSDRAQRPCGRFMAIAALR